MKGVKKWVKVTILDIQGHILLWPIWKQWVFLEPKINTCKLFCKSVVDFSEIIPNEKKIFILSKMGEMKKFYVQNQQF